MFLFGNWPFRVPFALGLRAYSKAVLSIPTIESIPKILNLGYSCHVGFILIYFEEQFRLNKWDDVIQSSFCTFSAFAQYHEIICVAHKFMPRFSRFLSSSFSMTLASKGTTHFS